MKKVWYKIKTEILIPETLRYIAVGVAAMLADLGTSALVKNLCFSSGNDTLVNNGAFIGSSLGWIFCFLVTFFGNKIFVFRSRSWAPQVAAKEFIGLLVSRGATFFVVNIGMLIFVDKDVLNLVPVIKNSFSVNTTQARNVILFWIFKILLGIFEMLCNYFMSKYLVFRKNRNEKQEPEAE